MSSGTSTLRRTTPRMRSERLAAACSRAVWCSFCAAAASAEAQRLAALAARHRGPAAFLALSSTCGAGVADMLAKLRRL